MLLQSEQLTSLTWRTMYAAISQEESGNSSTLIWDSTNANRVYIDQGIGYVNASGAFVVSPVVSTTYTITAWGEGGTTITATTKITVIEPPLLSC